MLKFKTINSIFIILLLLTIWLIAQEIVPLYSVLILGGLWFGITAMGATMVRLDYFFPALHENPSVKNREIALTFDDGPEPQTLKVLELLKQHNIKATFFCIGHKIDEHPEIFKQIIREGHTIGNHSYSHPKNWGFLSSKTVQRELESCDKAAKSRGGVQLHYFRMPFGNCNPNIAKSLKNTGHQPVGWSLRSFDALLTSEENIFKRITTKLKPGQVILMHDTQTRSYAVLKRLLLYLDKHNYNPVRLEELFDR